MTEAQEAILDAWYRAYMAVAAKKEALSPDEELEKELRKRLVRELFPKPTEGVNTFALPAGYALKATIKLSRDVDVAVAGHLRGELAAANIAVDTLIEWKASLNLEAYRMLTDEQKKIFDQCLTITTPMPSIKLHAPKASE